MSDPPPLPPLPPAIGLDLGTSYSRAAVLHGGQLRTIADERGNTNFPTCVGFSSDPDSAVVMVGKEARDFSALHPTNTAIGFKRLIGRTFSDPRVAKDEKYLPIELAADENTRLATVRVRCKGRPTNYTPDQLMTILTGNIVENAFTSLRNPVRDAVVTVPSCFNLLQRHLVHQLCEEAGLNVLCTVNEATAAGIAHCFKKPSSPREKNILVVNIGAGFLSVVVMAARASSYEVRSIAGSCDVSGSEIDHILVDYYLKELKKKIGRDIPENKTFVRTLRLAAAAAKRRLSTSKQATITFQLYNCEVGISKAMLEDLCANVFKTLMDVIESALRNCNGGKLGLNKVDDIVLVGDGTNIPKVPELIQHFFNGKDLITLSSDSAAHGAALLAAVLQNRTNQIPSITTMVLTSVLPSTLSIEGPTGLVTTVIPKNAKLPAREKVKVTTTSERQQKVVVNLYEGESPLTKDNLYLGQVALTIPLAPRGTPKIAVTVESKWDGTVVATVMEESSYRKAELTVSLETMSSTPVRDSCTGVVVCEEELPHNSSSHSVKQGDSEYYFLPPDAVAPSPPLIPRRISISYENVKFKDKEVSTQAVNNCPPLPPKRSYENVELKEKSSHHGATVPAPSLPVPLKRTRVPRTPPREQQVCPITPPLPRRSKDKPPEKSMLLKSVSVPYCSISPNSPQLPRKERSDSTPFPPPLKENEDSAKTCCDNPSPYYSLPPDVLTNTDITLDDDFDVTSDDEEAVETYLTLDEDILPTDKTFPTRTMLPCPPLPPKDTVAAASLTDESTLMKKPGQTGEQSNKSEGHIKHLKERLLETELRMKVLEEQVAERDEEVETLNSLVSDAEEKLNEEKTRAETAERERASFEERASEAERRVEEVTRELQELQRTQSDSSSPTCSDRELQDFDQHQFWVVREEEIHFTEEEIGRGGWGVVVVAEFRGLRCAAKNMHKLIISDYNRHLFVREMNIAARVRHPNLVQFIGATVEREPIILMELMACSLRSILEKKPLNPAQVLSIGLDVARGINYLHLMRPDPIIHRDISSANVLLNPIPNNQWIAKLSDYGSANFVRRTQTAGPGNPTYAAPEASEPSKQGPKMDVYSYGVLLLEMCTRKFPDPKSIDNDTLLRKTQSRSNLAPTIKQCLNVHPNERPSMDEVIVQLSTDTKVAHP